MLDFINKSDTIPILDKQKIAISSIIYNAMKERNLSQQKLAKEIDGVSPSQINRVVNSDTNYAIETLLKILNHLDLKMEIKRVGE